MVIAGPSNFVPRFVNSLIIAFGSTFLRGVPRHARRLRLLALQGAAQADDLLFFILSTRMMPPIAVAIPIYLMYRELGLSDTAARHDPALHRGQRVARGLAAQGLHRRDPARIRGGRDDRRLHAAAGLPQGGAAAGDDRHRRDRDLLPDLRLERIRLRGAADLAATAQTAPPFIPIIIGEGGQDWPAVAAGTTLFLVPILVFTDPAAQAPAARHHLRSGAQMSTAPTTQRHVAAGRVWLRRGPLENIATALIALGVVMLMQPFALVALHLVLRHHARRHARCSSSSRSSRSRRWPRSASRTCSKAFGDFVAVQDSNFTVEDGEFFVHARAVGLRQDDDAAHDRRARAADLGPDPARRRGRHLQARARERDIAFVFQLFALYPHMNVRKNIGFPLLCQGMPRAEIRAARRGDGAAPAHRPSARPAGVGPRRRRPPARGARPRHRAPAEVPS